MALSEQERKLLEQLEASLKAEDPQFVETLSGRGQVKIHRRRATIAGLGFVLGLAALLGGIQLHPIVSIVGFALMVAATIIGINSWQRVADADAPADAGPDDDQRPEGPSSKEFMDKLEERWRKRQEGEL